VTSGKEEGAVSGMKRIERIAGEISEGIRRKSGRNLQALILYGSWAKGTAGRDSDIDLLALFRRVGKKTGKIVNEAFRNNDSGETITLIQSSCRDFRREKIPLYTAVKKEGRIIRGAADFSVNPELPSVKYAEFFRRSKEFETGKVKMAEEILKRHPDYGGAADICFVAAKHAIQAALAMKGMGYSSKVKVLLPLAREHLGREVASDFKTLFSLYVESEYGLTSLNRRETRQAIRYAKRIFKVYRIKRRNN
jgi:predicted nucleotidyltransferase/HEPN domain-containing protein